MHSGHDGKGIAGKVRNTTGEQQGPQRAIRTAAGGVSHLVRLMAPGLRSGPSFQKCITKVHYNDNGSQQWYKHGFYLMRQTGHGFTATESDISIASHLGKWQAAGDARFWTAMVRPENGHHVRFEEFTRDLMQRFQDDLGSNVEWVAAIHPKEKQPHVHIAWRGVDTTGQEYRIPKGYIPWGLSNHAEALLTAQLGYRRDAGGGLSNSLNLQRDIHDAGGEEENKKQNMHHKRGR